MAQKVAMPDPALQGIVVAEIGTRIAAGVCGSLLAQLGAQVIVPELPVCFDGDKRYHRGQLMPGKLSLEHRVGDLKLLRRILAKSDVVVVSSDADPDAIRAEVLTGSRPDLVVCDISAFGEGASAAKRPFTDIQIQALSGILDTTGLPDQPPTPIRFPIVEFMTGIYAAAATVAALRVRRLSGSGQRIDMALYDCAFASMSTFLPRLVDGSDSSVVRVGNRHAMAAPWNVYHADDGWVLICAASDMQWRRVCGVIGRMELAEDVRYLRVADRVARFSEVDEAVQAWVGRKSVSASLEQLAAAGIPSGAVTPVDGYPREANLVHRGMIGTVRDPASGNDLFVPRSPLRMTASPGISPTTLSELDADRALIQTLADEPRTERPASNAAGLLQQPLAGLRVIEIGHYTTAPLSARHLANLGAEVIKVEPPDGEAVRSWPPSKRGQGYFFTFTNSDKRSLTLDLESKDGLSCLRDLLTRSDVLIENLKPGSLAKRGFSAETIAEINPRLIYCAVSGFGDDSIYKSRPAFDSVIQAMSGIMDLTRSGDIPVKSGISSADLIGAETAVLAVLAALEYRDRTGSGQYIDLSMQDVAAWATMTLWDGTSTTPPPLIMPARDGYVVVEQPDSGIGNSLPDGGTLTDLAARTRTEIASALERHGYQATPVLSARETIDAPRTKARGLVFRVTDDEGEEWPLLASPLRLQGTPPRVRHPMPALGRDGPAIMAELGRD